MTLYYVLGIAFVVFALIITALGLTRDDFPPTPSAGRTVIIAGAVIAAVTFVVDTAPAGLYRWNHYPTHRYPRLQQLLDARFELAVEVDNLRIFRRRGCAPAAAGP